MDRYLQFLCNIVDGDNIYSLLLKHLHRIEFYSFVPNDDNRGEDGKKLREIYLDREGHIGSSSLTGLKGGWKRVFEDLPTGPCSVLEMLIGLSYRIENELEGGRDAMKCPECFWMLMHNLGLNDCTNAEYLLRGTDDAIDYKIRVLLDRKYEINGVDGLFPLRKSRNDQRKIEIWYQMQEYLLENYEF